MSERMVELQRAKLGLPPPASTASARALPTPPLRQVSATAGQLRPGLQRQSSQQLAAATLNNEDQKLQTFLQRLQQQRDGGPTVPTALARRMLHRQGVGYLDDTVAMLTSAAADRFLATVLQQAAICRDRRISGQEQSKEEAARRRKHVSLYQLNSDYRKRRKSERTSQKIRANVAAVAAAREVSQRASAENKANASKKKIVKKVDSVEDEPNGTKPLEESIGDDELLDDDSLDEEENYYHEHYGAVPEVDEEEESEEDLTLLLRDLERPLEAWHFKLTGKVGLGVIPIEAVESSTSTTEGAGEPNDDDENDEEGEDMDEPEHGENGDSRSRTPKPSPMKGSKSSEHVQDSISRAATPLASVSAAPK